MLGKTWFSTSRLCDVLVLRLQQPAGLSHPDMIGDLSSAFSAPEWTDVRDVLVDCGQITYGNSMLLEGLLRLHQRVRERGGRLALCGVNQVLGEILSVGHFDTLWKSFPSVEDGLRAFVKDD